MLSLCFLISFVCCGALIADRIFCDQHIFVKTLAGVLFGLVGFMWCVVPFAFLFHFTIESHVYALILMLSIMGLILRYVPKKTSLQQPEKFPRALYLTVIFIFLILGTLMFRQIIRPQEGGLFVGFSTYGDLVFHLGIITNIVEQEVFPPIYSIFPQAKLTYPFLVDSLSSSLYLLGFSLRWAVLIPSLLLAFVIAGAFVLFAKEVLKKTSHVVLAAALFFFNGGLGFIYFLDGIKRNPNNFTHLFSRSHITPTGWGDKNLYMWNVIAHVLVPQRTTLAGWAMLFFIVWLLYKSLDKRSGSYFLLAGILAGLMPMIHLASFFGLVVISLTWFIVYFFGSKNKKQYFQDWSVFFVPLAVLSFVQIFFWMIQGEGTQSFLNVHFNWINSQDSWIWFWIKNAGLVFLLLVPSLVNATSKRWCFYAPAIVLFVIGESLLLGPWAADNNKIFFIWYFFSVILVSEFIMGIFARLKGVRGREIMLGAVILMCILSGVLTVCKGMVSSDQLFSKEDLSVAEFVKKNTLTDGLFVSANFHNNPVAALAGRNILLGYHGWVWSHGFDYGKRAEDIKMMYTRSDEFADLQRKYEIDYLYFSHHERGDYKVGPDYFDRTYPKIFSVKDINIYAVSKRAQEFIRSVNNEF